MPQLSEWLSDARHATKHFGCTTIGKLNEVRPRRAKKAQIADLSARTASRRGPEVIDNLSGDTVNKLDSSADSVRGDDERGILADLRQAVGQYPAGYFVIAADIGLLVGAALQTRS